MEYLKWVLSHKDIIKCSLLVSFYIVIFYLSLGVNRLLSTIIFLFMEFHCISYVTYLYEKSIKKR